MVEAAAHYEAALKLNGYERHQPSPTDLAILSSAAAQCEAIASLKRELIDALDRLGESIYDSGLIDCDEEEWDESA